MTRAELGVKANIAESTIAKLERGETKARYSTIARLATALDISREQLVNEDPESPK